ncbi:MAG: hypothetical protein MK098_00810 [Marinovum sp.]|nr:hypothetical protein [Marinovum sp.]
MAALTVSACTPDPSQIDTSKPALSESRLLADSSLPLLSGDEALKILERVCDATYPSFSGAYERAEKLGATIKLGDRRVSTTKRFSVDVTDNICSVRAVVSDDDQYYSNWQGQRGWKATRPPLSNAAGPVRFDRGSKPELLHLSQARNMGLSERGTHIIDIGISGR